jgi:Peptidase family M23
MPPSHRTTARSLLLLLVVGVAAATAGPVAGAAKVPQLIFPVVGKVSYIDDFGDPRGQGGHQGNDLMAPWRAPVVAVEAGKIEYWTTSSRAGCMLYLYGASGTTYLYIHLNNDLTRKNDNRGKCVAGTAYWKGLKNGQKVAAGQPIAYVGNSGDADGIAYHLHFEVHPGGGGAVSPYRYLRAARKLLFPVLPKQDFTAALRGKVLEADELSLTMNVERVQMWPGSIRVPGLSRKVELNVSPELTLIDPLGAFLASARISALKEGQPAIAWTEKAMVSLKAALGEPLAMTTEKLVLSKLP